MSMAQRIVTGKTDPHDWRQYPNGTGVYVEVDTSAAGFTGTPQYFTSIAGISHHWATTGATSIYKPGPTGFTVYVRWAKGDSLTPAEAAGHGWYINWMGVEST